MESEEKTVTDEPLKTNSDGPGWDATAEAAIEREHRALDQALRTIVEQQATIKRYGEALRTVKYTDHFDLANYTARVALRDA